MIPISSEAKVYIQVFTLWKQYRELLLQEDRRVFGRGGLSEKIAAWLVLASAFSKNDADHQIRILKGMLKIIEKEEQNSRVRFSDKEEIAAALVAAAEVVKRSM